MCVLYAFIFVFKVSLTDSTALYTKCNSSGRPHQVWRHEARHPHDDTLLFEEEDPRFVARSSVSPQPFVQWNPLLQTQQFWLATTTIFRSLSCTVDVTLTRDKEYITINSNTRTSSEVSLRSWASYVVTLLHTTHISLIPRSSLAQACSSYLKNWSRERPGNEADCTYSPQLVVTTVDL